MQVNRGETGAVDHARGAAVGDEMCAGPVGPQDLHGEPWPGIDAAGISTAMSRPVRALNSASSATLKRVHAAATTIDPSGVMTGLNTPLMPPASLRSVLMISRDAVSAAVAADPVSSTRTPPSVLVAGLRGELERQIAVPGPRQAGGIAVGRRDRPGSRRAGGRGQDHDPPAWRWDSGEPGVGGNREHGTPLLPRCSAPPPGCPRVRSSAAVSRHSQASAPSTDGCRTAGTSGHQAPHRTGTRSSRPTPHGNDPARPAPRWPPPPGR